MKKIKKVLPISLLLAVALVACEKSFDFDKELYEKVVNLISNSEKISNRTVLDLNKDQNILYVGIGLGGTQPSDQSVTVELDEPTLEFQHQDLASSRKDRTELVTLFNKFNKSHYDVLENKFAKLLPRTCYNIPSLTGVIPAGSSEVYLPINVTNIDYPVLSPDSTYFVELAIKSVSGYKINKEKNRVLYQIFYENEWASTKVVPTYSVLANKYTHAYDANKKIYLDKVDTLIIAASPKMFPLSKNSVRVAIGDLKTDTLGNINRNSLILNVDEATKSVTVKPYKTKYRNEFIYVETLPGNTDYPNKYQEEHLSAPGGTITSYKTFKIRFKYYIGTQENPDEKAYTILESRMRLRFNKSQL